MDIYSLAYDWFQAHREEMTEKLKQLVRVPSVAAYGEGGYDYGVQCHRVMELFESMCRDMGFATERFEDHSVCAVRPGETEKSVGLWAHLDVVPAGDGWSIDPFDPVEKEGWLIGRGCRDNKCAAVGGLYVLKCLNELGVPLRGAVRVYASADEEVGSCGVIRHAAEKPCPDMNIVTDSDFPVCYAEKGILNGNLVCTGRLSDAVTDLRGGLVSNMIPDQARAVLKKTDALMKALDTLPPEITVGEENGAVVLSAKGICGHAAHPRGAVNAIMLLLKALLSLPIPESDKALLAFPAQVADDFSGARVDIDSEDPETGRTSCASTVLSLKDGCPCLHLNIRYCLSCTGEGLISRISARAAENGYAFADTHDSKPNYYPREKPVVDALTEIYNRAVGKDTKPYTMSGGTYARKLPNAFAYGLNGNAPACPFQTDASKGGAHQPDEVLHIDSWLQAMAIITEAVAEADACLADED